MTRAAAAARWLERSRPARSPWFPKKSEAGDAVAAAAANRRPGPADGSLLANHFLRRIPEVHSRCVLPPSDRV
jgi:hypothetical protein